MMTRPVKDGSEFGAEGTPPLKIRGLIIVLIPLIVLSARLLFERHLKINFS